jgi:hypothetical protein
MFTVHLVTGDEPKHVSAHFVAAFDGEEPDQSTLDCRDLTSAERDSMDREMTTLADAVSVPNSDDDREKRHPLCQ